jgi:hypothetical protein
MRLFRGSKQDKTRWFEDEVLWGVPRREGYSDTSDPLAHTGLTQHAFEFGIDDRAICGFEPPRRPSRSYRDPRPQLALAGTDNPRCPRCAALLERRSAIGVDELAPEQRGGETLAQAAGIPHRSLEERPSKFAPREPGWELRQTVETDGDDAGEAAPQAERRTTAGRRSVRRGGIAVVPAGRKSIVIDVPEVTGLAGIVANVEPPVEDLRVATVTLAEGGKATIGLSRTAPAPVRVAWYLVLGPATSSG